MYFLDHYRTRISQVIGLLFLFLFMFSQKELDVTAPYISGILFLVGCLCVGAAMAGRMWCAQYIAGYKNDVLVREGPYSVCRNPLYFFSFLGGIGVGLCTESLTLTVLLVLLFAVMYIPVIHTEEARLHRLFGEPYSAYIREVPRFSRNGRSTMNLRNIQSNRKFSATLPATSSGSSWPSASWNVSKPYRNQACCRSSCRFIK